MASASRAILRGRRAGRWRSDGRGRKEGGDQDGASCAGVGRPVEGGSCGVRAERRRDGEEEQVREMRQSKAERLAPQPPRLTDLPDRRLLHPAGRATLVASRVSALWSLQTGRCGLPRGHRIPATHLGQCPESVSPPVPLHSPHEHLPDTSCGCEHLTVLCVYPDHSRLLVFAMFNPTSPLRPRVSRTTTSSCSAYRACRDALRTPRLPEHSP